MVALFEFALEALNITLVFIKLGPGPVLKQLHGKSQRVNDDWGGSSFV